MKKLFLIAVLMICLVPASLTFAQTNSIGGFASYVMPMAPENFKDYWKPDIGFGGEIKFGMSPTSAIVGTFHMLNTKMDADKFLDELGAGDMGVEIEGGGIKGFAITANYMKYFSDPSYGPGVYFTAGGGYYSLKPEDMTLKLDGQSETWPLADEAETGFGINGGLGLEFGSGAYAFFVEARYHFTFIKEEVEDDEWDDDADFGYGGSDNGNGDNFTFLTIKGGIRVNF